MENKMVNVVKRIQEIEAKAAKGTASKEEMLELYKFLEEGDNNENR